MPFWSKNHTIFFKASHWSATWNLVKLPQKKDVRIPVVDFTRLHQVACYKLHKVSSPLSQYLCFPVSRVRHWDTLVPRNIGVRVPMCRGTGTGHIGIGKHRYATVGTGFGSMVWARTSVQSATGIQSRALRADDEAWQVCAGAVCCTVNARFESIVRTQNYHWLAVANV